MRDNGMDSITSYALKKARLTELQAIALSRYLSGLKHREIAEEMGCDRSVVTRRINVAIEKIRGISPCFGERLGAILQISIDSE